MKVDVVIPLGHGSRWSDNELRFCLRAWETNFLDLGNVWIVGEKPAWCVNVRYLRMPDFFASNKDANLITKVMTACYQRSMTPAFVRSSDDEILLRPKRIGDLRPYHQGEIRRSKGNRWHRRLDRTGRWLRSRGLTAFNYDSHLPAPMQRDRFFEIFNRASYKKLPGLTIDSTYFNCCGLKKHVRLPRRFRLRLDRQIEDESQLLRVLRRAHYVNLTDRAVGDTLERVLTEIFPNPSRFEKG
jgi:hypothetical protein